jgi:hypothetical protein
VVRVRFHNPAHSDWNYSLFFREMTASCRLLLRSTGRWELGCLAARIGAGVLRTLDISRQGSNLVEMVVSENVALLYVNGAYVTSLDVSSHNAQGRVFIQAGEANGDFQDGVDYNFSDFTVWALP